MLERGSGSRPHGGRGHPRQADTARPVTFSQIPNRGPPCEGHFRRVDRVSVHSCRPRPPPSLAPSSPCSASPAPRPSRCRWSRPPAPGAQAPDLRADPVQKIEGPQVYSDTGVYGAGRLLVRFEGYVTNVGDGPLEVSGNPQDGSVRQRAWSAVAGPGRRPVRRGRADPEVVFEAADGHDHFHLKNAMRYSLWNLERTAQVAPGQKAGFCLYDIEDAPSPAPPQDPEVYTRGRDPVLRRGRPGRRRACAWGPRPAGATSTTRASPTSGSTSRPRRPGRYLVASEADPENRIWEGGGQRRGQPAGVRRRSR